MSQHHTQTNFTYTIKHTISHNPNSSQAGPRPFTQISICHLRDLPVGLFPFNFPHAHPSPPSFSPFLLHFSLSFSTFSLMLPSSFFLPFLLTPFSSLHPFPILLRCTFLPKCLLNVCIFIVQCTACWKNRGSQEVQGSGLAVHTSWLIETDTPTTKQIHEMTAKRVNMVKDSDFSDGKCLLMTETWNQFFKTLTENVTEVMD